MITLGELIDKLTVVNLKIWHLEDVKRDNAVSDSKIAEATRKTNVLNVQRNQIIEEIDNLFADSISGKISAKKSFAGTTKVYGE